MREPDVGLPLFVYGIFRPGELGWLRLREWVEAAQPGWSMHGEVRERDGLAILDMNAQGRVDGWLLRFRRDAVSDAYSSVADVEPQHQYRWVQSPATCDDDSKLVNVLAGRRPCTGSTTLEGPWAGHTDPLLTVGLDVVGSMAASAGSPSPTDLEPLFRLQAAYLLLFAAVERYASLRYGLRGGDIMSKLSKVANEPAFGAALADHVVELQTVRRADNPGDSERLDPTNPMKSMRYYYQLRSNISHRGKAAVVDFRRLVAATESLRAIFSVVVAEAFADASTDPPKWL